MVLVLLMETRLSDPEKMKRLFDVVEELARNEDHAISTFVKIEFCEALMIHDDWFTKSGPFMGEATRSAYVEACERWREIGWMS
jgi:hypothetical protein